VALSLTALHADDAQDAQRSAAASQKVAEARRKQINPLNHPLVQQYFQQK
jgi:septal ring factor EnvC (AmiA/AmiB activator)